MFLPHKQYALNIFTISRRSTLFFSCVCVLSIQDQTSINHPGNHKRECLTYTKRSCLIHSNSFNMFEPNNMRGWNQWWRSSSPALWQVVSSCPTSVADPMPTRRAFPRNHPGTLKKKGAPKKHEMDKPSTFLGTHVGISNYYHNFFGDIPLYIPLYRTIITIFGYFFGYFWKPAIPKSQRLNFGGSIDRCRSSSQLGAVLVGAWFSISSLGNTKRDDEWTLNADLIT